MFDPRKIQAVRNIQNLKEFNGSMRQAIKSAGYSDAIANNPKSITDRKWFLAAIPGDDDVSHALHDLLQADRLEYRIFPITMNDLDIIESIESIGSRKVDKIKVDHVNGRKIVYFFTPDWKSRKEAVDTIIKIKGHYAAEKHEHVIDPLEGKSLDELLTERKELVKAITVKEGVSENG